MSNVGGKGGIRVGMGCGKKNKLVGTRHTVLGGSGLSTREYFPLICGNSPTMIFAGYVGGPLGGGAGALISLCAKQTHQVSRARLELRLYTMAKKTLTCVSWPKTLSLIVTISGTRYDTPTSK
jgi:hypothetical protein